MLWTWRRCVLNDRGQLKVAHTKKTSKKFVRKSRNHSRSICLKTCLTRTLTHKVSIVCEFQKAWTKVYLSYLSTFGAWAIEGTRWRLLGELINRSRAGFGFVAKTHMIKLIICDDCFFISMKINFWLKRCTSTFSIIHWWRHVMF